MFQCAQRIEHGFVLDAADADAEALRIGRRYAESDPDRLRRAGRKANVVRRRVQKIGHLSGSLLHEGSGRFPVYVVEAMRIAEFHRHCVEDDLRHARINWGRGVMIKINSGATSLSPPFGLS